MKDGLKFSTLTVTAGFFFGFSLLVGCYPQPYNEKPRLISPDNVAPSKNEKTQRVSSREPSIDANIGLG